MEHFFSIFDFLLGIAFVVIGGIFFNSNGRASKYIAGYNVKNEDERKNFDEVKLCKTYGKRMMFWSIPYFAGCMIDFKFEGIGMAIEFILFIILLIWHINNINKNMDSFKLQ